MICEVGTHSRERGNVVLWRCVWLGGFCLFFFSPDFLLKPLKTRRAKEIGNTAKKKKGMS